MEPALPIEPHLEAIAQAVTRHGAAVVVAPPGAGKTTRVPPRLAQDGPLILLQPRRVAARSLARRIAHEQGWTLGREIGWHVRFDRRYTRETRLLVATEGILTARFQHDPLLGDFRTVVLDEFHERSIHADLALAFARQAALARDDLRLVVMSATIDAGPVAAYLGDCPVIAVKGRAYPLSVDYAPGLDPAGGTLRAVERTKGHTLCFLPGAPEIRRTSRELSGRLPADVNLLPLHGSLDAAEQDRALAPTSARKLILCTNIAETSITVDGVSTVVDCGLHKLLRYDPGPGIDRLELERIAQDSADQRAGRAGRTGPGHVLRLWNEQDRLRPRREPEIERVDLTGPLLDVLAWGGTAGDFDWFEVPDSSRIGAAHDLLQRLGAVHRGRITELGRRLRRLPLHPRLARVLLAAGGSPAIAAAVAALAEGWTGRGQPTTSSSDLLRLSDDIKQAPLRVRAAARELERLTRGVIGGDDPVESLAQAILAGYPDRVAQRRAPGSDRLLLASGHGARLSEESGVRDAPFLVAVDLVAGRRGPGSEARVRLASAIEPDWLDITGSEVVHTWDENALRVRAVSRDFYERIPLGERPVAPDAETASRMLAEQVVARGPDGELTTLLARLAFAGVEVDLQRLAEQACLGRTRLDEVDLRAMLPQRELAQLARLAPERIDLPSGGRAQLNYAPDGSVFADVKLQELFGLPDTPRLGPRQVPVTLRLLAPNRRPVQTTQDLRSFWERTYPEVRRELRGRYAKHPWPEDPWSAQPTARTKRRR